MAIEINDQFDFFKNVQLDNDGNLLVSIVNLTGATGDNYYTTGATLSGTVVTFDRTDLPAAYSVDLSSIAGGGNIDGGTAASIVLDLNVDGGNASS
jgi:hypothetical protein